MYDLTFWGLRSKRLPSIVPALTRIAVREEEVTSVPDDNPAPADTPPQTYTPEPGGRPPPPPIDWDTDISTRGKDSDSLSRAAMDVVKTVIRGQDSD